jgi:hypothetical protein
MKFAQGDFEPQNFYKIGCFRKLKSVILLTFIGVYQSIFIEVMDNLCKIFSFFGLLFGGTKGVDCVKNCFTLVKSKVTGLNEYQLFSLEE